jgi:hypothetical protein
LDVANGVQIGERRFPLAAIYLTYYSFSGNFTGFLERRTDAAEAPWATGADDGAAGAESRTLVALDRGRGVE